MSKELHCEPFADLCLPKSEIDIVPPHLASRDSAFAQQFYWCFDGLEVIICLLMIGKPPWISLVTCLNNLPCASWRGQYSSTPPDLQEHLY